MPSGHPRCRLPGTRAGRPQDGPTPARIRRDGPPVRSLVRGMTVAETEQSLLDELALLPDPQERLAHLMRRAERRPPLPAAERTDEALVPGCVSRVWLTATLEDGRCRFLVAADSPMVLGLMGLLCDVYEGAPPAEVSAVEPTVLARSGLDRSLSPTRLQGLAQARARLRQLAAELAAKAG